MAVPVEIHGQKYLSLATFRKSGLAVYTPIWFAEEHGRLYFMTNSKVGKYKRIRNNPKVTIAPCTMRGKIIGPEIPATLRILRPEEFQRVRRLIGSPGFPSCGGTPTPTWRSHLIEAVDDYNVLMSPAAPPETIFT